MAAKLYHTYIALSRVFDEIFQKNFSPHSAHNPETVRTFTPRDETQSRAILNCRVFAIETENDF